MKGKRRLIQPFKRATIDIGKEVVILTKNFSAPLLNAMQQYSNFLDALFSPLKALQSILERK